MFSWLTLRVSVAPRRNVALEFVAGTATEAALSVFARRLYVCLSVCGHLFVKCDGVSAGQGTVTKVYCVVEAKFEDCDDYLTRPSVVYFWISPRYIKTVFLELGQDNNLFFFPAG